MHLKQLKLSGFKSFVEPTIVPFPSQLVAVLGPNGCGKSNIIDAVRWVLGESSAKNLRGEAMTDVIFNGSSHRKPVGQAQVELIFDNSLGRLQGEFGRFQEVSVKRVVTREGDSAYYLNGTRCRRRDITDLFLGTGAGAHGYSIIGQGTISKIIEAKPEELRGYFEEAAGISKYKERRKESLARMNTTREHLERVSDIRTELDKQLERLTRQARAARRFKELKTEEREIRVAIHTSKWQQLQTELLQTQTALAQVEAVLAHLDDERQQALEAIISKKHAFHAANEALNIIQASYYQLGTDIARIEQQLILVERERTRQAEESSRLKIDWQNAEERMIQETHLFQEAEKKAIAFEQQASLQKASLEALEQQAHQKKQQFREQEQCTHSLRTRLSEAERQHDRLKLKLQHLEHERHQLLLRLEVHQSEQKTNTETPLEMEIVTLAHAVMAQTQMLQEKTHGVEDIHQQHQVSKHALNEAEQQIHQLQKEHHQLNTELLGLKALQSAMLQLDSAATLPLAWQNAPKVFESLQIEPQWQPACEFILGASVRGIVLEDLSTAYSSIADLCQNLVLTRMAMSEGLSPTKYPSLRDKIQGAYPQGPVRLEQIMAAPDFETALAWLPHLAQEESVVTPQGVWLSSNFIYIYHQAQNTEESVLTRQGQIEALSQALSALEDKLNIAHQYRDEQFALVQQVEENLHQARQCLHDLTLALRQVELALEERRRTLHQQQQRHERLLAEGQQMQIRLEEIAADQLMLSRQLEETLITLRNLEDEHQASVMSKTQDEQVIVDLGLQLQAARDAFHATTLELTRTQQLSHQHRENLLREQERQRQIDLRLQEVAKEQLAEPAMMQDLKGQLEEKVALHMAHALSLDEKKASLLTIGDSLKQLESLSYEIASRMKGLEAERQNRQMTAQALSIHCNTEREALHELGQTGAMVEENSVPHVSVDESIAQLQQVLDKIKQLGPINLVAIEEFEQESQRKQQLDTQYHDLVQALETLEAAISQMDKETTTRLSQTFEEVNQAFSELFPRLFGGGHAQLLLTCDNLLEAGVIVMAQPPGKRNSSIHLLSGGEKAMTAVALIFAIFQLNPSPFCMLDEVDAPLDDANVGRFCDLVKEMSQVVQFLFITHNKVTMALAEHLIGVTMREPGVSRVVTVDIEQALALAE